ncbi:MAG: hypothetical protein C4308_07905 [Chitinophagaceae bacterium]
MKYFFKPQGQEGAEEQSFSRKDARILMHSGKYADPSGPYNISSAYLNKPFAFHPFGYGYFTSRHLSQLKSSQ